MVCIVYRKGILKGFISDETTIQIGNQIDFGYSSVLNLLISVGLEGLEFIFWKKNMVIAEKFIRLLISNYGINMAYTDGDTLNHDA